MNEIIQVSFKKNIDDRVLRDWLEGKFEEHGNKSNYIKSILRKEMKKEMLEGGKDNE